MLSLRITLLFLQLCSFLTLFWLFQIYFGSQMLESFVLLHIVVQSLNSVQFFATPCTEMCQAFLFFSLVKFISGASLIAWLVKNPPAMQETPGGFLDWEDSLKKGKATHFSILAWRSCKESNMSELLSLSLHIQIYF